MVEKRPSRALSTSADTDHSGGRLRNSRNERCGRSVFNSEIHGEAIELEPIARMGARNETGVLYDMIYIKGSALFGYLRRLPKDHTPKKSCPLVVGLHGGGGDPEHLITLWDHFPDKSFIYAAPQGPYPALVGAELGFDWAMWPTGDRELIGRATELAEKHIVNVVQDLTSSHDIDEVYLMGFSQGAIFAYLVGVKHHQVFRGIICLSGPGLLAPLRNPFGGPSNSDWLTERAIQDAGELRVFIAHGRDDQEAGYEMGTRSRDVLLRHGYDVTFRDFDGGHTLPPEEILAQVVNWIEDPLVET